VSVPVVVLALGTATAAVGATAGLWLFLIGAELALFALVWLVREIVIERRAVRR
jgi:HAMP domain-containing protein